MRRRLAGALMVLGLAVVGVGCSDDDSGSGGTTTTEAATDTTATRGGFDVQTEAGQVTLSLDGELPPGWPDDFPVPEGATPAGSGSLGSGGETGFVGVYESSGSAEDTYDFYASGAGLDVESQGSVGSGERFVGTVRVGGSVPALVTIVPDDGGSLIVIVLETSDGSTGTTTGGA